VDNMPLTATGRKVLAGMREEYGDRAEEVFYRSINKGVAGSKKWHAKKKKKTGNYSSDTVRKALGK